MRCVELCFHERDAIAADLAVRGLGEAGVSVLRRPISDTRAPAISRATDSRIVLYSATLAALPADHPAFAPALIDARAISTVAVPLGPDWPLRASRSWLIAPATPSDLRAAGFWKIVAWASTQAIPTRHSRIAAQQAVFRALEAKHDATPVGRRRPRPSGLFSFRPLAPARSHRDWEAAATPMAVLATLVMAAGVSAVFVDVAARPEAWGAVPQAPATVESATTVIATPRRTSP